MTPSYALGLLFIFLVSVIWAASSVLVQHLYRDLDFDSPFVLTYVSVSLFVVFLPGVLIWERLGQWGRWFQRRWRRGPLWHRQSRRAYGPDDVRGGGEGENEEGRLVHGGSEGRAPDSGDVWVEDHDRNYVRWRNPEDYEPAADKAEGGRGRCDGGFEDAVLEGNLDIGRPFQSRDGRTSTTEVVAAAVDGSLRPFEQRSRPHLLSHVDHIRISLRIAPVWFFSNYFYNISLKYTSISSSTVLSSTGSLFTFLFAALVGDERVTWYKLAGVVLCFAGSVITGLGDAAKQGGVGGGHDDDDDGSPFGSGGGGGGLPRSLWGDLAGLTAAIGYGAYSVLLRISCPKDESRMSMGLMLGYVGLMNGLGLMPVVIKVLVIDEACPTPTPSSGDGGGEMDEFASPADDNVAVWTAVTTTAADDNDNNDGATFACVQTLTLTILSCLLLKALFDDVLSDYLWARAVVMTSATVATVGLGLTVPLAFLSDWALGRGEDLKSIGRILGAVGVLAGFILVNCGEGEGESGEQEKGGETDSHNVGGAAHSGGREAEGEGEVEIVEDQNASTLALA